VSAIRQFLALIGVSLPGLTQRKGPVVTIIIGVTCAVGVLVSMLAMGAGARRQEMSNVRPDRAVLGSLGAEGLSSSIPRNEADAAHDLPYIRTDADGRPIMVLETLVFMDGRKRGTGARIFFPLTGVTSNLREYAPELRMTAGRMFNPGLHELIASNACARLFSGFGIGDRRVIRGLDWTVVGHFDQGRAQQCVVYADVNSLMSAFSRETYNFIGVMLQSPGDFAAFRAAVKANPTLHLDAERERDAMRHNFRGLNGILDFGSYFVGTILAIGGTLGAINSLYAIVDSRRRELATLRAIGFRSGTIVASMLCESMVLALPGALLGAAIAWVFVSGLSASPFGYSFQLDVTPDLVRIGVIWALVMGFIGGILPAVRAARVSVTTALRAV
jgi:putative ABC transport system permease protein